MSSSKSVAGIRGWALDVGSWAFSLFSFSPLSFALAFFALAGYLAPWLTHPAAGLRLSGFELAEWVTFLPGVRDGSLPLSRLAFLTPPACLALLWAVAAARAQPSRSAGWRRFFPGSWVGWALLALALLCNLLVLPPYEVLRNRDYWLEYQPQFIVAGAAWLGIAACQFLPKRANALLQIIFALVGGGYGAWALTALRPAANELLNAPWAVGYGWMAMLVGFAGLAVIGAIELFTTAKRKA
jgi:hypothetical protein